MRKRIESNDSMATLVQKGTVIGIRHSAHSAISFVKVSSALVTQYDNPYLNNGYGNSVLGISAFGTLNPSHPSHNMAPILECDFAEEGCEIWLLMKASTRASSFPTPNTSRKTA